MQLMLKSNIDRRNKLSRRGGPTRIARAKLGDMVEHDAWWLNGMDEWKENKISLDFKLVAPKLENDHLWTDGLTKTVKKEYYIMTQSGMIGVVGGTLGLFVGLSFIDLSLTMVNLGYKALVKIKLQAKDLISPAN